MKRLKIIKKKSTGRSSSGQVVVRHQGGEHKRYYRIVDFKRDKRSLSGKVVAVEYDPNRSADVALVQYADGDKRYILSPNSLKIGDVISAGESVDLKIGFSLPLKKIPVGTIVHNVELHPGRGGQLARSAGTSAIVSAIDGEYVHLKLPSGEVRRVLSVCYATIGQLGRIEWKDRVIGKAGRKRNMGIRPTVRGVAQNPRSHPHGGGEGRSGIGMTSPKNYAGRIAVGKTRRRKKYSDKFIVKSRSKKK